MEQLILATRIAQWYNPMDMFLSAALNSKYIHSELIFPRELLLSSCSFSSRGRVRHVTPRVKGVQFTNVNYKKGKWLYTPLRRVTKPYQAIDIAKTCQIIEGAEYDSLGAVFNAGFKIPLDKTDKYWCSEAVAFGITSYYPELKTDNITPETLLKIVRERF